jgi:hypothetical protein
MSSEQVFHTTACVLHNKGAQDVEGAAEEPQNSAFISVNLRPFFNPWKKVQR